MKYLKIEDNKGFFLRNGIMVEIDKINKEDIYYLISSVILNDNDDQFEMDVFSEETLQHGVHKIIYKNIYTKLSELLKEKDSIRDSVNQQFASAIQKYSNN